MRLAAMIELGICWVVWWYPFLFLAPHRQNRPSVTRIASTRVGLFLETAAIFVTFIFRLPRGTDPEPARLIASMILGPVAVFIAFGSVRHLGKQFRVHAGLYEDHELVRSGPYALVRHPIYASLFAMMLSSALVLTPWPWIAVAATTFIIGTEIRVHTEDGLLRSRFGESFLEYKRKVSAYIPFVR
jgi:protein-S-isoprenylcysteine O-methyltransferase Ste14